MRSRMKFKARFKKLLEQLNPFVTKLVEEGLDNHQIIMKILSKGTVRNKLHAIFKESFVKRGIQESEAKLIEFIEYVRKGIETNKQIDTLDSVSAHFLAGDIATGRFVIEKIKKLKRLPNNESASVEESMETLSITTPGAGSSHDDSDESERLQKELEARREAALYSEKVDLLYEIEEQIMNKVHEIDLNLRQALRLRNDAVEHKNIQEQLKLRLNAIKSLLASVNITETQKRELEGNRYNIERIVTQYNDVFRYWDEQIDRLMNNDDSYLEIEKLLASQYQ